MYFMYFSKCICTVSNITVIKTIRYQFYMPSLIRSLIIII
nr:MAG TPA: hypothetical protein [Caudoviricetes sp.]